jgi:hypothetical protein
MRFVDLFLISFLPLALSQATLSARGGTCEEWDLTREHPSCQCLPGFENPGKAHKECTCADEKNTQVIVTEVNKNDHALLVAKCECFGGSQSE